MFEHPTNSNHDQRGHAGHVQAEDKDMVKTKNDKRGRGASRPSEIPRKGWWDILLRVKDEQSKDNLSILAAGVAFIGF